MRTRRPWHTRALLALLLGAWGASMAAGCSSARRWTGDWADLGESFQKVGRDITGEPRPTR